MKTPVHADKQADVEDVALSYENPQRFDHLKMFPNSNWEFEKLDKTDIKGIIWFSIGAIIVFVLFWVVATAGKG